MPTLLDLLTAGEVQEFNARRADDSSIDLFAADLSGAQLAGVDLSGLNLEKADLSGADLTGAMLARTDLSGADLTGAKLSGVVALRSKWRETFVGEADLRDADFTGANLQEVEFEHVNAAGARFSGARLKQAILVGCDFSGCDFSEAHLGGADLTRANLTGATLREAKLVGTNFTEARLAGADLFMAHLKEANLTQACLNGARFASADLTDAVLSKATVSGADFTRADLTGATFDHVDWSEATLSDAEIAMPQAVDSKAPPIDLVLVEDPAMAATEEYIALLWENPELDDQARLRVAIGRLGRAYKGSPKALPVPADLVLSRAIVVEGEGFLAVTLVERPGGVSVNVTTLDNKGKPLTHVSHKLGFTPAVRPVVLGTPAGVRIYAISREGPGLHVLKITDTGLEHVHASRMPTVRGFVGPGAPIVLSKGGAVLVLGERGPGDPIRAPASFPGQACSAVGMGKGVALGWIARGQKGVHFAHIEPGEAAEERHLFSREPIGAVDVTATGTDGWMAFTRILPDDEAEPGAWAVHLPDGKPFAVLTGDVDIVELRFVPGADKPTLLINSVDGGTEIFTLTPKGAKRRWGL